MKLDGLAPDPVYDAARYRATGLWRGLPLGSLVGTWAREHGDRRALVDATACWTYHQLADRVDALAARLIELGLRKGDTILVQLPNGHAFAALILACLRTGVAPALMLPAHREHELTRVARHLDAVAIAVPARRRGHGTSHAWATAHRAAADSPTVRTILSVQDETHDTGLDIQGDSIAGQRIPTAHRNRLPDEISSADIAFFLLSGGTTGQPKIIARTHDDYELTARRSAEICGYGPATVTLVALPAAHTFALGCPGLLGTFIAGGTAVMLPSPRPDLVLSAIERERVTATACVPAVARRWLDHHQQTPGDLTSLQLVQVGGARLPVTLAHRIREEWGCVLQQVYGMSEGLLNMTRLNDPTEVTTATQGRPMNAADEILIVDEAGCPVPAGEPGELLARGPTTIAGYYRAAHHNSVCFTPEGWYRTGDIVRRRPDGNLVVSGRIKDLINRAGEKIVAEEMEELLTRLPGIAEAAVVGVPDDEVGERVLACLVLAPGRETSLAELRDMLFNLGVAAYKLPELLAAFDDLPRTTVGKVDKRALRDTYSATTT